MPSDNGLCEQALKLAKRIQALDNNKHYTLRLIKTREKWHFIVEPGKRIESINAPKK